MVARNEPQVGTCRQCDGLGVVNLDTYPYQVQPSVQAGCYEIYEHGKHVGRFVGIDAAVQALRLAIAERQPGYIADEYAARARQLLSLAHQQTQPAQDGD